MQPLLTRLEYISNQCQDPSKRKGKEEAAQNWDDFTKLRKKIAVDIKKIREQIEERNKLFSKSDSANTQTVRMGKEIRNALKDVSKEIEVLEQMQNKDAEKIENKKLRRKEVDPEEEKEVLVNREEIVKLCKQHIEECRKMERSIRGTASAVFNDIGENDKPTVTSLPDIDGDEGFQLLHRQDKDIDEKLDRVSQGVSVLKEMAVEMGKEIELQEVIIDELDKKVDATNEQLLNLNKRMKKVLERVRKADRFCIDIIILVVILAIAGYIYNLFA